MQTRTVRVENISDLAGEREVREFFSFSGDIEHLEIHQGFREPRTAFVTFKDPKALEIALLLSGATIVDQIVRISPVEYHIPKIEEQVIVGPVASVTPVGHYEPAFEVASSNDSGKVYVSKVHDVVTGILARGSEMGQDVMNKAKAFDEKHRLTAGASAKVISFDRRVGLSEKITVGISVANEKVKSMDQKLHVSEKTMAVLTVADQKLFDTGSAVKRSRYVSVGTTWFSGAFNKVAKAGHVAGATTREKFRLAMSNLTAKDPIVVA